MTVPESDAAYLRRLGAYKRQSHEDALLEHLSLPLDERLRRSWDLSVAAAITRTVHDDPEPFYDRARALGLYRP